MVKNRRFSGNDRHNERIFFKDVELDAILNQNRTSLLHNINNKYNNKKYNNNNYETSVIRNLCG